MPLRAIEYRQMLQILSMFMIVQFGGLAISTLLFNGVGSTIAAASQSVSTGFNVFFFAAYVITVTIIVLLIMKIYNVDKLMMALEALIIILGGYIIFLIAFGSVGGSSFNALMSALYGNVLNIPSAAAFAAAVVLLLAKRRVPSLRNLATMVASVGAGLLLGVIFNFALALLFMVILAVYDFIAVFVTKHMVALADVAMKNNLAFMVTASEIKAVPLGELNRAQRTEYNKERPLILKQGGLGASLVRSGMVPIPARTGLGNGDLAVPLMLAVSAYKVYMSFTLSLVVAAGSVLGLVITMAILRRYRRALPAIPPLLLGILIALGIYFAAAYL